MKSTFLKQVFVIVLGVLFVTGVSGVLAEPTCAPPGCNAAAPINKSNIAQSKDGGLIVGKTATVNQNTFVVAAGKAGFNTGADPLNATVDINGTIYTEGSNSRTTATAALTVVRYLDGQYDFANDAEYASYDVDGNGVVDIKDALIIMNLAVGIDKKNAEQRVYGSDLGIGMIGDINPSPNGDGVITASDGLRIQAIANGTLGVGLSEYRRADITGDGVVTSDDVQAAVTLATGADAQCSAAMRGKIILLGGSTDTPLICKMVSGQLKWTAI